MPGRLLAAADALLPLPALSSCRPPRGIGLLRLKNRRWFDMVGKCAERMLVLLRAAWERAAGTAHVAAVLTRSAEVGVESMCARHAPHEEKGAWFERRGRRIIVRGVGFETAFMRIRAKLFRPGSQQLRIGDKCVAGMHLETVSRRVGRIDWELQHCANGW